jgi:DNA-binding transcriptional regulator YiaG
MSHNFPESPKPEELKAVRMMTGLSPTHCGAVVYVTAAAWRHWESGQRKMSPGMWELFNMKSFSLSPYKPFKSK